MAEALMRERIGERLAQASVSSAGLLEGGQACPTEIVDLMAELGVDLSPRRSRQVTAELIDASDLVLTMEREHLREIAVRVPSAWPRTFTLKELVRRGTMVGWRNRGEPVENWIARAHAERDPAELLGASSSDDVADPYGGTVEQYAATKLELGALVSELADLIWPDEAAMLGFTGDGAAEAAVAPPAADQPVRRSRFGIARRG
jgi:protein-tyrosine phosphatase